MKISKQLQTGEKFGRLTVIKLDHIQNYKRIRNNKEYVDNIEYYLCKCDCGNDCIVQKSSITKKYNKSCGCLKKENSINNLLKINLLMNKNIHNLSNTKLYSVWQGIKSRCYNKNKKSYKYYGARGINICDEWKNDFMSFYNWAMANGYKDNLTIDRINNNGNYEPNNCRWVDNFIQANNKNNNIIINYKNKKTTLSNLSKILNINYKRLFNRYSKNNNIDYIVDIIKHKNQFI